MKDKNPSQIPGVEDDALRLWAFAEMYCSNRSWSLASVLSDLESTVRTTIRKRGIEPEFDELVKAGFSSQFLGLIVAAAHLLSTVADDMSDWIGDRREGERFDKTLTEAADALQQRFKGKEEDAEVSILTRLGYASPYQTVKSLRMYAMGMKGLRSVAPIFGVRDLDEFSNYLLTAIVKAITARFHDREVSSLLGAFRDADAYDETAHRMWRHRNFERLDAYLKSWVRFLVVWNRKSLELQRNIPEQK